MEAVGEFGGLDLSGTKPIGEVGTGYTFFADGDVVVAKITPCFENGKGAQARNLRNGVAFGTTELHVLRANPAELCPEYLFYLSISQPFRAFGESSMYGAGGQKRVPEDFVKNFRWPLPPLSEQRAIAAFLDRETARIDSLIARKRRLIELLLEKRAATITRVVTRGLREDVPVRQVSIKWLGDVPRHWGVTRLKHATSRIVDCPHETPRYSADGEYVVVRTADIGSGLLRLDAAYRVDEGEYLRRIRRESLKAGDVVYGREGERWGNAASVPAQPAMCLGQRMMQFRASEQWHPRFLMWQLNALSVYRQGAVDTAGATSPHVNVETIRNYWLAEPPLQEQRLIAEFLDKATSQLDRLTGRVHAAIERIREYRSALIAAAVTGQIDVRGAA